ncbi:MAG: P-loop NTPase [Candidatus Woesearchaeota archaeon]
MTVFIGVHTIKGGVGKTSLAINLTSALVQFHQKVILVDCHLTKPNISLYLGLTNLRRTIQSVLAGQHYIQDSIVEHPSGIKVIAGEHSESIPKVSKEKMSETILDLSQKADLVIVDPPNELEEAEKSLSACDSVIVVSTPDLVSLTDAAKSASYLRERGISILGLVITKHTKNAEYSIQHMEKIVGYPVIGIIPDDTQIQKAQQIRHPLPFVDYQSPATHAYKKLAAKLIGQTYVPSVTHKQSFFSYVLERMGLKDPKLE